MENWFLFQLGRNQCKEYLRSGKTIIGGYVMDIPEFLQLFDALVVGGDATDMGQFHNFIAGNIKRVYTFILFPHIKQSDVNADVPNVDSLITDQANIASF